MTVATLLLVIQILSGLGGVSNAVLNIKNDLEKRKPADQAPPEHVSTVTDALWDATHAPE
jgi:hypothetical protein